MYYSPDLPDDPEILTLLGLKHGVVVAVVRKDPHPVAGPLEPLHEAVTLIDYRVNPVRPVVAV